MFSNLIFTNSIHLVKIEGTTVQQIKAREVTI